MKPVLLAWEMGANLGHAMPLAEIAKLLLAEDIRPVCFARDLRSAKIAFRDLPVRVFQSPVWPPYRFDGQLSGPGNYANVLTAIGFTRPELLSAVVDAWIETLKLISPGVVVCDNAPALQIAAKIRNIPTIALGTPYLMPPLDGPNLPAYDAHFSPVVDERQLLESAARIFAGHDKPPPKSMPSLLATDFRFVFGLPEIDPYLAVRRENLYLPLGDLPKLEPIPALPRYFVYLGADEPVSKKLFQAIADSGLPADIYMRDDSGMLARFLRRRGFNVFADPPKLDDVLPKVTHVISAGGAHVTQAAMLAGRHHIMLPRHEESWSNARMATRLKVASVIGQNEEDKAIRGKITSTVADHSLLHNAIRLATELAQRQNRSASSLLTGAIKRYCS